VKREMRRLYSDAPLYLPDAGADSANPDDRGHGSSELHVYMLPYAAFAASDWLLRLLCQVRRPKLHDFRRSDHSRLMRTSPYHDEEPDAHRLRQLRIAPFARNWIAQVQRT